MYAETARQWNNDHDRNQDGSTVLVAVLLIHIARCSIVITCTVITIGNRIVVRIVSVAIVIVSSIITGLCF